MTLSPKGGTTDVPFKFTVHPFPDSPVVKWSQLEEPKDENQVVRLADYFIDPDGEALRFQIPQKVDSPIIQGITPDQDRGKIELQYTPYTSGTAKIPITATDPTGRSVSAILDVTLPELLPPTVEILDSKLNRQTGLMEQRVKVSNPNKRAIGGFHIEIANPPAGMRLMNGAEPDKPVIRRTEPLAGGESVALVLEWYSPRRELPGNWEAKVTLTLPQVAPVEDADTTKVQRMVALPDGGMLLEFDAEPGRRYEIHYSDDGRVWRRVYGLLEATNRRQQWIDQGPPKTDRHPRDVKTRLYRFRPAAN